MILTLSTLPRINRDAISAKIAILLSILCLQTFAESSIPPIDDRCEITKAFLPFDENAFRPCDVEVNECTEARMSRFNETEDQAQNQCWRLPLSMDPDFDGPCPAYMEELESRATTDRESLMRLVLLRNYFSSRNEFDAEIDVFKRNESLQSIRSLLEDDPNNPVALKLLHWTLLFTDDLVEQLNLKLKIQRLDPDCPESTRNFLFFISRIPNEIVDNWLVGQGSGSELTIDEIRDLLLRLQETLLDAYDFMIEDSEGTRKLDSALDSVHDAILGRKFENFQQISRHVEIGLNDYKAHRREELVRRFSRDYDVDSHHGRSQSLTLMCSSLALDLGLLDQCTKLLNHFGYFDSKSREYPERDWTRAAISLMIGLTRDCSQHADLLLGHWPMWWSDRPCLSTHYDALVSHIIGLLERFLEFGTSAEREVLEAYLLLDESSDERFLRALALDESMVVYASRLSKRLHKLGKVQAASNILSNIDAETANRLTKGEKRLLENTTSAIRDDMYQNWIETSFGLLADKFHTTNNP